VWPIDILSSYSAPNGRRSAEGASLVDLFLHVKNCSIVCLKHGILRPTLRKWLRRYEDKGRRGLNGSEAGSNFNART